jgi:hypothetical protein
MFTGVTEMFTSITVSRYCRIQKWIDINMGRLYKMNIFQVNICGWLKQDTLFREIYFILCLNRKVLHVGLIKF